MTGKILLPLDGSEASLKAYIPAKSIAGLLGMTLCILHITDKELGKQELIEKLNLNKEEDYDSFMFSLRSGDPAEVILEESENCNYIVMGTHGQTCDETLRMGSITRSIIENTFKPVLLIKPNACLKIKNGKWLPSRALIPLNGAPKSAQSLIPAMDVLVKTSAEIELLHIFMEKKEPIKEEGSFSAPYYEDYPQHEWPSWTKEFLKRFSPTMESKNHIKMNVSISKGEPAREICIFAEKNNNDFIAMAWHGTMSQFRAMTLKSLLFRSNCPIMLIKIKD